jgi:hypothetical protein
VIEWNREAAVGPDDWRVEPPVVYFRSDILILRQERGGEYEVRTDEGGWRPCDLSYEAWLRLREIPEAEALADL